MALDFFFFVAVIGIHTGSSGHYFLGGKILSQRYFLGVIHYPGARYFLGSLHIPGIFAGIQVFFRVIEQDFVHNHEVLGRFLHMIAVRRRAPEVLL